MKKAIIIGATSGIGRELAKILADNKYVTGITGRRKEKLEELKSARPESYIVKAFDCTKGQNTEMLDDLFTELGGLDLLILSSGTGDLNENLDYQIEKGTIDLNVSAFTEIAGWAFKIFEKQGHGHLAGISSIGGLRGGKAGPSYNASKAYQINYLEGLRQKSRSKGGQITITDIRPGLVDTDMAKGEGLFWVTPKEKAARQIFNIIKREKDIGYVTRRWAVIALVFKILPNFIYKRM